MLLVIPVSRSDVGIIDSLVSAIEKFTPGSGHELLVVGSPNAREEVYDLAKELSVYFNKSNTHIFENDNFLGWPVACGSYFQQTAFYVAKNYQIPWFWCELDCCPIKDGWLSTIEKAYFEDSAHFPFMGKKELTIAGRNGEQLPPEDAGYHMAPTGVYPYNIPDLILNLRAVHASITPWFEFIQWFVLPKLKDTDLIQNNWRTINYRYKDNKIVCDSDSNLAWNTHYNHDILDTAVLVHGCKDGTLANLLTESALTITSEEDERLKKRLKKYREQRRNK